mmetsp:Transcript_31974/g.38665  ORF Transcript_31974/g.38665 Transcript_31974/m.38665 type:complete len:201 (+) Transcript_31974:828-1430(+)
MTIPPKQARPMRRRRTEVWERPTYLEILTPMSEHMAMTIGTMKYIVCTSAGDIRTSFLKKSGKNLIVIPDAIEITSEEQKRIYGTCEGFNHPPQPVILPASLIHSASIAASSLSSSISSAVFTSSSFPISSSTSAATSAGMPRSRGSDPLSESSDPLSDPPRFSVIALLAAPRERSSLNRNISSAHGTSNPRPIRITVRK